MKQVYFDPTSHAVSVTPGDVFLNFGADKWKKVVDSGGDLSVLGVAVKKNSPVVGFDEHWEEM